MKRHPKLTRSARYRAETERARVAKLEDLLVRVSERPGLTDTDRDDIRAALKGG